MILPQPRQKRQFAGATIAPGWAGRRAPQRGPRPAPIPSRWLHRLRVVSRGATEPPGAAPRAAGGAKRRRPRKMRSAPSLRRAELAPSLGPPPPAGTLQTAEPLRPLVPARIGRASRQGKARGGRHSRCLSAGPGAGSIVTAVAVARPGGRTLVTAGRPRAHALGGLRCAPARLRRALAPRAPEVPGAARRAKTGAPCAARSLTGKAGAGNCRAPLAFPRSGAHPPRRSKRRASARSPGPALKGRQES